VRLGAGKGFGLVLRGLGRDCRDVLGGWNRSLIRDRGSETPWERRIKNLGLGFGDLERERRERDNRVLQRNDAVCLCGET